MLGVAGWLVSAQAFGVTGIRQDPFAERNRIPVEQEKPAAAPLGAFMVVIAGWILGGVAGG